MKPSEKSTIRYAKSIVAEALPGVQKIRAIAPGNDGQTMHNPGAGITRRLHNHAGKISAVRRQRREDCTKLIRQATLQYDPIFGTLPTITLLFECRSIPQNFVSASVRSKGLLHFDSTLAPLDVRFRLAT